MDLSDEEALLLSDTHRAEAFSDAVFAIVATLLALDLKPPPGEPGQLLTQLLARWPTYLAFLTSFLYVGVLWLNHKAVFAHVLQMDRMLHWLNLGVLATVTLLPFPTAVIAAAVEDGNPADEHTAIALYGLVGALVCASWLLMFHHLGTQPQLVAEDVRDGFYARERTRAVAGVVLYAVGAVLGVVAATGVALAIFLALPVFYGITSHGLTGLPRWLRWVLPRH
jgi:uncharacterized membrane protein